MGERPSARWTNQRSALLTARIRSNCRCVSMADEIRCLASNKKTRASITCARWPDAGVRGPDPSPHNSTQMGTLLSGPKHHPSFAPVDTTVDLLLGTNGDLIPSYLYTRLWNPRFPQRASPDGGIKT